MPDQTLLPNITAAIVCDEIRSETNNKLFFIGVYSGDIVLGQFPAALTLSVYVALESLPVGDHSFEMRLTGPSSTSGLNGNFHVEAIGPIALPTPPLPVHCPGPGEIIVDLKIDEGDWHKVLVKRVLQAPIE